LAFLFDDRQETMMSLVAVAAGVAGDLAFQLFK
jgi:hypothetical protein